MSSFNLGKARAPVIDADDDFNWILCTGAGNIVITDDKDDDNTLTAPPLNVWMPIGRGRVVKTGTTATGLFIV